MKASDPADEVADVGDRPDELAVMTAGTVVAVLVEHIVVVVVEAGSVVVEAGPVVVVAEGSVVSVVPVARKESVRVVVVVVDVLVVGLVVDVVEVGLVDDVVVGLAHGTVVVVDEVPVGLVVDVVDVVEVGEVVEVVDVDVVVTAWTTPGDFADGATAAMAEGANAEDRLTMPTTDAVSRPALRRIQPSSLPSRVSRVTDSGALAPMRCPGGITLLARR